MPGLGAARAALAVVPAALVVVFAGLLVLLGLFCGQARRDYALAGARQFVDFAGVLVGGTALRSAAGDRP